MSDITIRAQVYETRDFMTMERYATKEIEPFYIGNFSNRHGLSEWHLYPESLKVFINVHVGSNTALQQAEKDEVQMYYYPTRENGPFVNIDWMIERNIVGEKGTKKLKEVKTKILEMFEEENGQANFESKARCG